MERYSSYALFILLSVIQSAFTERPVRWCVTSEDEALKCQQLQAEMSPLYKQSIIASQLPKDFRCVRGNDAFACMNMIEKDEADLIVLDSGQGYFAGRQYNMMPIMAEDYKKLNVDKKPSYYSVAIYKDSYNLDLGNLASVNVCFPGIGMSAGWVHPIGSLLRSNRINIVKCNAIVNAVSTTFQSMCLPGAVNSFYNPFGNNPTSVCALCTGSNNEFCSTSDNYAGYAGAFDCVSNGVGQLTFTRHDIFEIMNGDVNASASAYKLLCPDGSSTTVDNAERCNWGVVSSNLVMTSAVRDPETVEVYKKFLTVINLKFGSGSGNQGSFNIYKSEETYAVDPFKRKVKRKNLLFSDNTKDLIEIKDTETYFSWAGKDFQRNLVEMNNCPSETIRMCVTSYAEKLKCEDMIMAFKAKSLKPEMDCLFGGNTSMCLEMIWRGDADLINLDAGDVYIAGRRYGLVPIIAEDYGDMSMEFKVVAAARKTDKYTTLFNMKGKRSCQPGIGRGDGWIVPLNVFIETEQFLPEDCTIFRNIGELFVRSCIPGALDSEYNPGGKPINLCEGCAAGGYRKCQRNAEEQYYGASGAFRCLVEKGGDVAFVRHLTVRDNTDGRNHAIWARNRRSDDYELMCKDGRRLNIDRFEDCHLATVPSNAIVTSRSKSALQKEIIWNLLNYGQQFFSSDIDGDFHMFDSGTWYTDLLFTDAAVRLMRIPEEKQEYTAWLGESFIAQIENLHKYTCVNPDGAAAIAPSLLLVLVIAVVSTLLNRS